MLTEAHEPKAGRALPLARLLRVAGHDHLAAMGSRADPGRRVDGEPDVVDLVERWITAVESDPDADLDPVHPGAPAERALHGDSGIERSAGALEHGEELVRPRLDGLAGERHRRLLEQGAHVTDEVAVPLAQPIDEAGRTLDVGHQHGEEAGRQRHRLASATLPEGALGVQLARDEPQRHDPMPLRRLQQPIPRPVTSGVVLEINLVEPSQRVPDVGRVVDWETPPPPGVDVRERPIREVSPFRRPESSHELRIGGNPWLERTDSRGAPRCRRCRGPHPAFRGTPSRSLLRFGV